LTNGEIYFTDTLGILQPSRANAADVASAISHSRLEDSEERLRLFLTEEFYNGQRLR
jgi:hypothetical protein